MVKTNKPKPKPVPQAKPRPKPRQQAQGGMDGSHHEHHKTLCGLTDPFCEHAKLAKVPDVGAGNTFTESVRWIATLTSDASGIVSAAFVPKVDFPMLEDVSGAWNTTYTNMTNPGTLINVNGKNCRVTTYGIRIVSLLSAVDAKGVLAIASGFEPVFSTPVLTSPDGYSTYDIHGIGASSEWHVVGKPTGSESTDWAAVASHNAGTEGAIPGWNALYLLGTGLPATTASFRVELVTNFEYTFSDTSAYLQKFTTPQPIYNPQMLVARNEVMNGMNAVIKGGSTVAKKHLEDHAKKALVKHVLPFLKKKAVGLLT